MSRPRIVPGLILGVALALAAGGGAVAQSPSAPAAAPSAATCVSPLPSGGDAQPCASPAAAPLATEFFAPLTGTEANLVVALGPGTKFRAYACDGDTVALWWTGDLANGAYSGTSTDGGATLQATVGDTIAGTVTFKDGTAVPFTAAPTTGAEGLYAVDLQPDGTMAGTSLGGNAFTGQFDFAGNTLAGSVTTPAGETVTIAASQSKTGGTTSPGSYLAVLDAAGQAKGFQLRVPGKPSEGFVAGWVMP